MMTKGKQKTWTIQDRGYDCDQYGPRYDCTAESLIEAIRMLDGFFTADHVEPINSIRGCSTYSVYERAHRGTGATWNKIGTVYLA